MDEGSAQLPERSASPAYHFGASRPRFYQQSIIQSRYQAPRLKEPELQRSGWMEKRASETKPLQQQECQDVSKGADCGLKGWCPALLSASCETGAEPFQSYPCTTASLSQKISSDHLESTDLSWLQKGCLISKNFTTHHSVI